MNASLCPQPCMVRLEDAFRVHSEPITPGVQHLTHPKTIVQKA